MVYSFEFAQFGANHCYQTDTRDEALYALKMVSYPKAVNPSDVSSAFSTNLVTISPHALRGEQRRLSRL